MVTPRLPYSEAFVYQIMLWSGPTGYSKSKGFIDLIM